MHLADGTKGLMYRDHGKPSDIILTPRHITFGGDATLPDRRSSSIVVVVAWEIADDGESSNGEATKMCARWRYKVLGTYHSLSG